MRIGEAREIPGRIREGVQRVGVAHRRAAAGGAGRCVFQAGSASSGLPVHVEIDHRRAAAPAAASFRHRHHAAFGAMDHRDRAAPGPLARHQPVAQAVIHRALADAGLFQPRGDFGLGLLPPSCRPGSANWPACRGRYRPRCRRRRSWDRRRRRHHHRRHRQACICGRNPGRAGHAPGSRRSRRCRNPSARNWPPSPAASSPDRTDARRSGRCRSPASRPSRFRLRRCRCGGIRR